MRTAVRPRPVEQPALRLLGFHHAGGSSGVYYPMARQLPEDWDLVLIDLPGRGRRSREEPLTTLEEVVDTVFEDVQPWLDAPFALFGHSFGSLVALELARRLEAVGQRPGWVGVSGRAGPSFQARVRRRLYDLDDERLLAQLLAMGGTPDRIHEVPEFVERFLRLTRADLRAVESYSPHPDRLPLSSPITAFGGDSDPWAPEFMLTAWARETSGDFQHRLFPGGHFYFLGQALPGFTRTLVAEASAQLTGAASRS
ncbi:alpha/beta fold hydrolase [Kitasatospora sp. NBC_01287]|uniref:thioesterase II family protein n=1 Tax=Kitasatospora sp. NBC_01287 TaxID=2903573 RepID=UPI00224DBEFD|nr:alpha/beta fold hydrolase [Kitasatospora sp. NBC_01287]MCX4748873.1 alpha/beta fold hydrolase [Kitasatospora sp. NBC_01287]